MSHHLSINLVEITIIALWESSKVTQWTRCHWTWARSQGCQSLTLKQWSRLHLQESLAKHLTPVEPRSNLRYSHFCLQTIEYERAWNLFNTFPHQLTAGALTFEKSWPAIDNVLDIEAFIGIATMPTDDFTYKILLSRKSFHITIRIKAELISTAGQHLTFGPVEVRIGRKTRNGRPNKKWVYFLCRWSFPFGLLHNGWIRFANKNWSRNTFW